MNQHKIQVYAAIASEESSHLAHSALNDRIDTEVVGFATNGKTALEDIFRLNHDVVTLDAEMPEMNGLQIFLALQEMYSRAGAIMTSRRSKQSAEITIEALSLGTFDFIIKPDDSDFFDANPAYLQKSLFTRIKLSAVGLTSLKTDLSHTIFPDIRPSYFTTQKEVVLIGTSTGGPAASPTDNL